MGLDLDLELNDLAGGAQSAGNTILRLATWPRVQFTRQLVARDTATVTVEVWAGSRRVDTGGMRLIGLPVCRVWGRVLGNGNEPVARAAIQAHRSSSTDEDRGAAKGFGASPTSLRVMTGAPRLTWSAGPMPSG